MTISSTYLAATNPAFDECAHGLATLSRIVVAAPAAISEEARAALVPALYAYWERFFRTAIAEFLRCISSAGIQFGSANESLARFRIRGGMSSMHSSHRKFLLDALNSKGVAEARVEIDEVVAELSELARLFSTTISFPDPTAWVNTEANVKYEVVEKNCRNIGLDPVRLKDLLLESRIEICPALKNLVDTRNDIAHGTTLVPIDAKAWNDLQDLVHSLMHHLQDALASFLEKGEYLAAT